jgi:hypothetical protein
MRDVPERALRIERIEGGKVFVRHELPRGGLSDVTLYAHNLEHWRTLVRNEKRYACRLP